MLQSNGVASPMPEPEHESPQGAKETEHIFSPAGSDHVRSLEKGEDIACAVRDCLISSTTVTGCRGDNHMKWSSPSSVILSPPNSDSSSSGPDGDARLPVESGVDIDTLLPMPTFSPGCLTHAHQTAMANRISHDLILPGGDLDPALYTPVFLHDTLMLPGSLATVIGKVRDLHVPLDLHLGFQD